MGKRSERILEFHQLPSPLDISLMNWRAHTQHNGREKDAEMVHRQNEKAREREGGSEEERGGGWKNIIFPLPT